jgi:membrane fusion protein, heavy metal efflux system
MKVALTNGFESRNQFPNRRTTRGQKNSKHMKKNILLLLIAGLTACGTAPEDHDHDHDPDLFAITQEQMELAGIEVGMPEQRTITTTITVNGMVDVPPESLADISAPLGGFVRRAPHYEGTFVKKGDMLVALEHPEYIRLQQEYLEVVGQYEMLALEYERQEKLHKSVAAADKVFEQTRSNFKTIQARKEGLETTLRIAQLQPETIVKKGIQQQVILRAPFSGYITRVAVNLGKQVGPEEVLYQMVDPTHMHLELQVYPRDLASIQKNQKLQYRVQGDNNWKSGTVILVGQSVDPNTRTIRIHAHADADDKNLRPGVFIQAEIGIEETLATCLPEGAFQKEGASYFVFAETKAGFKRTAVEVTKKGQGYYAIAKLPMPGPFITKGAYYLTEIEEEEHEH